MYSNEIDKLAHSAEVKIGLYKKSKTRYLTSAMLGSFFVSLGIMLIYTIGGILKHGGSGNYKIVMGLSFGVALSLVLMAGGDLSEATLVSEQYLLDIEREAFLSLCTERKTLERIQFMLTKGKPLRN